MPRALSGLRPVNAARTVRAARLSWLLLPLMAATLAHAQAAAPSLSVLDFHNRPIDPRQSALHISRYVTNGETLPRTDDYHAESIADGDIRIEVDDADASDLGYAILESRTSRGVLRGSLRVSLHRVTGSQHLRSAFVRLVGDAIDHHARGVDDRTLQVALRDQLIARYTNARGASEVALRVASRSDGNADDAARAARLHIHILRVRPGGPPVIGYDERSALSIMRAQVAAANEVWLQCDLSFGEPSEVAMEIVDPPTATLLAVGDDDGLPARGDGELRVQVGTQSVGPLRTHPGATPLETAQQLSAALRARGLYTQVSENLRTRSGAGASADVLVRHGDGSFVELSTDPAHPRLSTDSRQSVRIGAVDLSDGLQEFDNMTAQVGSLEERTLLKALSDDDPRSIDLFVVNEFTAATRQGEAFISDPQSPIVNSVVIDRNGLRHLPLAWTLAHEIGHVLMNDPLHPDNVGPDRPWLLMDADSGRGTVDGPKRLRREDCDRVRATSASARFPLLVPFDPEPPEQTQNTQIQNANPSAASRSAAAHSSMPERSSALR
jgi:hypothetical protein